MGTRSWRRRRAADDGQTTLEWLGVGAVVVALVAALVLASPGLGTRLSETYQCLVQQLTGGGACEAEAARGEPDRECVTGITTGTVSADVRIAVINAGGAKQVRIVETSDGLVHVTISDQGELGASLEAGAEANVELGDSELGLGANASVSATLGGEEGETVVFDNPEDANDYIIDQLTDDAIDSLPPIVEQGADLIKDGLGGILGFDPPEGTPESTHGATDLTIGGEASATAGPLGAEIEAAVTGGGRITENEDGSRTLRVEVSGEVAGTLGVPVVADVGGAGAATVRLEVDIDADGNPTKGRVVLIGQGGVDDSFTPNVESPGDLLDQLTTNIPGGEGRRTVITAELDLTDPALGDAFGDLIGAAGGLDVDGVQEAGGQVVDALGDAGSVSVETYEITDNSIGAGARGSVGIGLGAGLEGTLDTATLVDAQYIDPDTGMLVPWEACIGGS